MFVGDRGYCVGSTIKGHLKYGGQWKPRKNSLYTSVYITNEHDTSQACLFLLQEAPVSFANYWSTKLKVVNGTFQCVNPDCPSVLAGKAIHARDSLIAMTIGLSGLTALLFGATFSQLDPKCSPSKTAEFEHLAATF
ncbi:hypothetical protein G6F70_008746 [Rhizopus microsporus]|uniref:Uncharacterized protein n=1 Tax=Rhizopus microsporus TaxID=58291 RepID=A0A1X0SBY7_RHIZD|nr:hypothetical protein G6F71_008774 [Rhizopus microsporus]KAG1194771.1 hypothetical protein G6F70_008746 [Rhizopus microsporus]KAG1206470.1 hypothetical protein G6F69_008809 [Rhizopus microsporus]KAG1227848.1 hypothetical protein G6F67_008195 [Rhizopus microsporus]KAG1258624.1 hypothetical protein G6F68_008660 [Rhizopus microsporus]